MFEGMQAGTDVGRSRSENQDVVRMAPGFAVVCDGMGGHEGGAVAARIAADALHERAGELIDAGGDGLAITAAFEEAFQEAARRVEAELEGVGGTTAVCAVATSDGLGAFVAHVGDSRAYLLRGDGVLRLTRDHNYEQVLLERGLDPDRAAEHPAASKLTQALGFGPVVPDVARVDVAPGDRLLLCSDGLYDMVDVGSLAAAVHERALGTAVELLIGEANRAGGLDNITVALLECAGQPDLSQILAHLRSQTLFERLDESELRSLATVLERRPFRAGEELMGEGKVGTDCLLLVRGKAHASRAGVHLTTIREGGHAGELALIRPWRRTATVTATTDGMAFVLTRHAFESLCALRPTLGLRLHRTLALRVADRLADLTTRIEKVQRAVDGL